MTNNPDRRKSFNTEIRAKSRELVVAADNSQSIVDHVNELADWLGKEIKNSGAPNIDRIACKVGCTWCCYQQVGITPLQALHIAAAIREGKANISETEAFNALSDLDQHTRGISAVERLAVSKPCAMLKDDACSIYEFRPYACRGANSVDAAHCQSLVEDPATARDQWKRRETPEWIHALPFEAMKAVQDGLRDGADVRKLPDTPLELTTALKIALEQHDAEERYLAGDDLFEPARLAGV